MTNQSSIKYISSLLDRPGSLTDGDHGSIALFRQTFPYFVPARYIQAVESHRKSEFAPAMISEIQPYMGNWMLLCEMLEAGRMGIKEQPEVNNRVVDKKYVDIAAFLNSEGDNKEKKPLQKVPGFMQAGVTGQQKTAESKAITEAKATAESEAQRAKEEAIKAEAIRAAESEERKAKEEAIKAEAIRAAEIEAQRAKEEAIQAEAIRVAENEARRVKEEAILAEAIIAEENEKQRVKEEAILAEAIIAEENEKRRAKEEAILAEAIRAAEGEKRRAEEEAKATAEERRAKEEAILAEAIKAAEGEKRRVEEEAKATAEKEEQRAEEEVIKAEAIAIAESVWRAKEAAIKAEEIAAAAQIHPVVTEVKAETDKKTEDNLLAAKQKEKPGVRNFFVPVKVTIEKEVAEDKQTVIPEPKQEPGIRLIPVKMPIEQQKEKEIVPVAGEQKEDDTINLFLDKIPDEYLVEAKAPEKEIIPVKSEQKEADAIILVPDEGAGGMVEAKKKSKVEIFPEAEEQKAAETVLLVPDEGAGEYPVQIGKGGGDDTLIFPVYTEDYFLQQGVKISDEIPTEIEELKEVTEPSDEDKSLMVMMSFSEWLLHFKNTTEKQKEEKKDQKALKTMWQKEKLAAAMEEENEEIPENVFEMAVNSITKEDGLASESLADIYIKQGKYDKAIEMYRKLSLRNPKKNAYFALKIEEVLKEKQS